jgi:vitamin B12 transporter
MSPPLAREGGPEDEPQARRPAGRNALSAFRGEGGFRPMLLMPDPSSEGSGFLFSLGARVIGSLKADSTSAREPMRRATFPFLMFFVLLVFCTTLRAHGEEPVPNAPAAAAGQPQNAPKTASKATAKAPAKKSRQKAAASSKVKAPQGPAQSTSSPSANSSAPSTPAGSTKKLPTMLILVTATGMEQPLSEVGTTASVVTGPEIQEQDVQSVASVLSEVPALVVTQSGPPGTVTDVSIRGASSSQSLIMIDGVPVNTSATGSFDFANLTTDNLSQIEVVRGAGGSLYGSQAIGGVINVLTKEGSGPPKFTMLSEGGNRATERQVLTATGAQDRLAYSGALSYFSTEGFRSVNDNSDNLSGALRLDYHLDPDTTVRGFARYIRSNASLANYSNFIEPIDPNAHQRNEFMLFKGEVDRQFGDRLLTRFSTYFVRDEIRLNDLPEPANPTSESGDIPDEIRGGNLEAQYEWTQGFRSLAGFDFKDRWVRSGSNFTSFSPPPPFHSLTIFHARRQEYAGYVEQEGSFLDGLILGTTGLRVDGNSQFGEELSPSWSVAIPLTSIGVTLRGSYSEGFRAPSFNELFFPSFGNPNLQPEISSEYDGGFTKTFGESAAFTATYFSRRIHNQIVAVPCPTCPFGAQAGNAGRTDTQGVELVPSIHPMRGLSLSGSLTILDETHVSPSSNVRPTRVPKYSASALAQYVHSGLYGENDRMVASLAYTFVGDRDDIEPSGVIQSHDAYHLVNAVLSYEPGISWNRVSNEKVFVRIQNLLDRHYSQAFGFPSPPINFTAGLELDF